MMSPLTAFSIFIIKGSQTDSMLLWVCTIKITADIKFGMNTCPVKYLAVPQLSVTLLFLPHLDVICDLLLNSDP